MDLTEDLGPVGFADPHTLAAEDGRIWSADRIILAVGGHAGRLQIPGADLALTYEDIPSWPTSPAGSRWPAAPTPVVRSRPSSMTSAPA